MGRVSSHAVSRWSWSPGSCCFRGVFWVRWDFVFFPFFFFERTRPAACIRPPCIIYLSTSTGVRTWCLNLISLSVCMSVCLSVCLPVYLPVCLCVCMCNIRRFTHCESCTRPTSTNPGPMEASEYGLTRGTCFVARRLEVLAVAGLLWIPWCILGGAEFSVFFFSICFFLRTYTACCIYEAALPHSPLY